MSEPSAPSVIRLRGVRHNNLKNFDLDLPAGQLIVVTGVSGSGKSSLAFDTLYAEGQRRYVETFSPYARQFFDRMDKPQVDSIQGIPPAIAIEQRNSVKSTRSTVGTMTEICDYMKLVWSHLSSLYCRGCGQAVRKDSPHQVWEQLMARQAGDGPKASEVLILFELSLSEKISLAESLRLISNQGYQRLLLPDLAAVSARPAAEIEIVRIEDAQDRFESPKLRSLIVVQDRLKLDAASRSRFVDACEQAYHFGKGKLAIYNFDGATVQRFSNRFHCAPCDLEYRAPTPSLFSFNHPAGACPTCRGFGRTITIDYDLAIPDRSLSLAQGVVKPWQTGQSAECQEDMLKFCRLRNVPTDVPFERLSQKWQSWVIDGDPDYGKDSRHEWPHAWYGVKGYFRWLESKAYKMHVRVLLSRYRSYQKCVDCEGRRLQPEALLYKLSGLEAPPEPVAGQASRLSSISIHPKQNRRDTLSCNRGITLADFYQLSVREALAFIQTVVPPMDPSGKANPLTLAINEVRSRLNYLSEVGLGYLTLDRPTRSLSGGETERVSLTTCLGSRLVNTLFVLDEPSVGLHPRDTGRLINILQCLRDAGNTVVVVEHEASVIRAADQIIDLGPGHGEAGGQLVFQGTFRSILKAPQSLTGQYLSGHKQIEARQPRRVTAQSKKLTLSHARLNNLKDLTVEIPLERLVCVTGVSGSGKTTLVRDVLLPALQGKLKSPRSHCGREKTERETREDNLEGPGNGVGETREESEVIQGLERPAVAAKLSGVEHINAVVMVDQSPMGKTPRSNPAVYIGAFEQIRELFAQSDLAIRRGLSASAFSFNSAQGQCPLCRGAGFEKIEMQFLSDVYVRCPECQGRRYRPHILEVKLFAPVAAGARVSGRNGSKHQPLKTGVAQVKWSIADLLGSTVDEGIQFLSWFKDSRPAQRAVQSLKLLQDVGLGYLRVGQPINTLSGGESQRLKLVSHLSGFAETGSRAEEPTLFLFDEPTTGLHFDDVRVLLGVFQRFVDAGHSVVVIEHNLDVIKSADWLIDLGPEAGEQGGRVVAKGTPENIARHSNGHTGRALGAIIESYI